MDRDRWEIAKLCFNSVDLNDFTLRTHLGTLHYATSIYTTAFNNLSYKNKEWKWIKKEFVDVFSSGILQIDFVANLTLIDKTSPVAEKLFHLTRA